MRLGTIKSFGTIWRPALLATALLLALAACGDEATEVPPPATSAPTATSGSMAADPTATSASMAADPTATSASMAADPTATSASMPADPTATAISMPSDPTATTPSMMAPATPIPVVSTTNIMADWVRQIGGDRVDVFSLVPVGADPHGYQPGAQDVARIADAELVLSVGLGLEESWLHELVENAARDEESIVELAELIDPIEFQETHIEDVEFLEEIEHIVHEVEEGEITAEEGLDEIREFLEGLEEEHHGEEEEGDEPPAMVEAVLDQVDAGQLDAEGAIEEIEHILGEGEEEHEDHGHGLEDPHFWFDPVRVKVAVDDIVVRLSAIDPDGKDHYASRASDYKAQLDELHSWTQGQVSAIAEEDRLLVTSHDSLGYFALLYDFEVVGVILGITTEVEPSAEDLIELIHDVEESGAKAIFGETTVSERLAETVASETGVQLVRLYSGSLGSDGSGAETYIEMIRTNVERIVEALA